MSPMSDSVTLGSRPFNGQVHVIGAGPVGLMLTALLQSIEGVSVHLYEKRREYTRTRMVQLAPYFMADSVETYRADAIDGDSIGALFDPEELATASRSGSRSRRTSWCCSASGRSGSARSTRSSARSAT